MNFSSISADLQGRSVMLEIPGFVSTGIISHIEGDLIEIVNLNVELYPLGQSAKAVIYAKGGLINFDSAVVGKSDDALIILNPPEFRSQTLQRRQSVRVPVSLHAEVLSILDNKGFPVMAEQPPSVHVMDIGLGGIAFHLPGKQLNSGSVIQLSLPVGEQHEPYQMLVLYNRIDNGVQVHGCKFQSLSPEQQQSLYAFTLGEQIRFRLEQRQRQQNAATASG